MTPALVYRLGVAVVFLALAPAFFIPPVTVMMIQAAGGCLMVVGVIAQALVNRRAANR